MSEIIYESVQRVTKRKVYLLETDERDKGEPVYLGSNFIGQEIIITGVIKGTDYADAKAGIEALENECKQSEEKTILDMTGKLLSVKIELKVNSWYQPFVITLGVYE